MTDETLDTDVVKFAYDKVYDELNRCRDWPMKAITLNSVLNAILVGFIKLGDKNFSLSLQSKYWIVAAIIVLSISTISIIIVNHLKYLRYRNIQVRLQGILDFYKWTWNGQKVIDDDFAEQTPISMFERWKGWLFHVVYIILLTSVVTILVLQVNSCT